MTKHEKRVRIYGAGGHSHVIKDVLRQNGYVITDTFDDKPEGVHHASKHVNMGARAHLNDFPHQGDPVIIAVGINSDRAEIARILKCSYETAIHQSAIISESSSIGEGTVVFAGAIVQPNTVVGKHVIVNTGASIDHDNVIGDYAHISPKAALCGHVEVGEGSHIGVGAVVIPLVKIGKWCTIGAGTIVLNDVPNYATVVGNPGKIIKILNPKKREKL
ncbi:acetyltransferase [Tamlana fucoidanivorans]|uniref:Acetyltransferase n=2 Tax=Allotamlana fucoidanivorans TaxID=2583814 RepID=A0A5C4SRK7_9FLAO|nr:acetyltransferase [Tamlana fucoidanivorans]